MPIEKKLTPLYLNQSLRSVSTALLSFFSSIYIFKKSFLFSGKIEVAISWVSLLFFLLFLFKLLASHWAENLSQKFGLKRQIYLSIFFNFLSLIFFIFSNQEFLFLTPAFIFWGLAEGFFWFGRHGLLLKLGERESFGRQLGWANAFNTLLVLVTPIIGGLLVAYFGYLALFLASLFFLTLSFLCLRPLKDRVVHRDTKLKEVFVLFKNHKRIGLAYFSLGAVSALYTTALILVIYLVLNKESVFGEFFSLSMAIVALANLIIGQLIDRRGKKQIVLFGSILSFLVWSGRFLAEGIGVYLVFDIIERISSGMIGAPLEVLSYEKALDGRSTGRAILFRETAICSGSLFACLMLFLFAFAGFQLKLIFLLAGLFCLLPLFSLKKEGLYGEYQKNERE